jgi:hypothetical protein
MNAWNYITKFFDAIMSLTTELKDFLFTEINLGFTTLSVWQLISGVGIAVILIAVIVKAVL